MRKTILLLFALATLHNLRAQSLRHYDFLGAGHQDEISVTVSSATANTTGQETIDGFQISNPDQLKEASRFLAQATFGADFPTIQMVAAMGYEAWLDEQFELPLIPVTDEMFKHSGLSGEGTEFRDQTVPSHLFRTAWITNNLKSPDLLRQRMAFNWSQIMVINDQSDFFMDMGQILGVFYDSLASNSFQNYQKLLTDVTLSPAMGMFLSHYNNPKEDLANNIHPDENYAREIMQLFSIGLWELNPDGTRRYDNQGQFIPTYSNANIKEFAQVFTGLGNGLPEGIFGEHPDGAFQTYNVMTSPMKMYDQFHDRSKKRLLNGVVLPANQNGMEDIKQTITHLSEHPNTAPFISKSLIKMLTTSNPSAQYVSDVATIFDPSATNNFRDVLKAILLHPEARNCNISTSYTFGKLREPVVRLMNFLRAFQMTSNPYQIYPYEMYCYGGSTGQVPMGAPSVFNFFLPDYSPPGPISQNYLVGPEFQILNTTNSIGIINDLDLKVVNRYYLADICLAEGDDEEVEEEEEEYEEEEEEWINNGELDTYYRINYTQELELINQPEALVDHLDILLANGLLSTFTKDVISNAVSQLESSSEKISMAIYLILISPDYAILR